MIGAFSLELRCVRSQDCTACTQHSCMTPLLSRWNRTAGTDPSRVPLAHGSMSWNGMPRHITGQPLTRSCWKIAWDLRGCCAWAGHVGHRRGSALPIKLTRSSLMQCSGFYPLNFTGTTKRCLNLGSYNYLGFAAADDYCTPRVQATLRELGVSTCSARTDTGRRHA